jgi:GGDEF domain-containing protein
VWLVVIDGDVYVNLGKRAAERLRANTRAPFVSVRIAGREFGRIRADPAQERQKEVAAAIAAKYWTGFLVPYTAPSQVMRLRPG